MGSFNPHLPHPHFSLLPMWISALLLSLPPAPALFSPPPHSVFSFPSDSSGHLDLGSSSPTLLSPFSSWVGSFSRTNAKAAQQTPNFFLFFNPNSEIIFRASLVAQWLRICLPMQGTRVRALVWEDPTCRGATRPVSHNY